MALVFIILLHLAHFRGPGSKRHLHGQRGLQLGHASDSHAHQSLHGIHAAESRKRQTQQRHVHGHGIRRCALFLGNLIRRPNLHVLFAVRFLRFFRELVLGLLLLHHLLLDALVFLRLFGVLFRLREVND